MPEVEIKPIHRIFASLIHNEKYTMDEVLAQDKEAVQYVLDTEYSNQDIN